MEKSLTLKDLYKELYVDPDLRRLGKYKVVYEGGRPIFPIVLEDFQDKDIHLGEGDFTEAFVALDATKARSLDLGDSVFTDLYLDYLEVEVLRFSHSRSSRVYFDYAKVAGCHFEESFSSEIYFDEAEIHNLEVEKLKSGVIHLDKVKVENVIYDGDLSKSYRFSTVEDGTKNFGSFSLSEFEQEQASSKETAVIEFTISELIEELKNNSDLRRLGRYRTVPEKDGRSQVIDLQIPDKDIYLGEGDFSLSPFSFGDTAAKSVDFGSSLFAELDFGNLRAETINFSRSKVGWLDFEGSRIGQCFFAQFDGHKVNGGHACVDYVYGENSSMEYCSLDSIEIKQFNINYLKTEELRLGESHIGAIYMSRGEGVDKMFGEQSKVGLLNLHEAHIGELHFDDSEVTKALINKATIDIVKCDNLKAELFYAGNYKNELGLINFKDAKGIKDIEIEEILPKQEGEQRRVFGKLVFGSAHDEVESEFNHAFKMR